MAKPNGFKDQKHGEPFPEWVQHKYDDGLKFVGKKMWQGVAAVASTGLGKGILIAAAVLLVGSVVGVGLYAAAGMIGLLPSATALGSGAAAATAALAHAPAMTIGQGLLTGAISGLKLMMSWPGLAMMGIGGVAGAAHAVKQHQDKITAQEAQAQSQAYAAAREQGIAQQLQQQPEASIPVTTDHAAREMQRRNEQPTTVRTI